MEPFPTSIRSLLQPLALVVLHHDYWAEKRQKVTYSRGCRTLSIVALQLPSVYTVPQPPVKLVRRPVSKIHIVRNESNAIGRGICPLMKVGSRCRLSTCRSKWILQSSAILHGQSSRTHLCSGGELHLLQYTICRSLGLSLRHSLIGSRMLIAGPE